MRNKLLFLSFIFLLTNVWGQSNKHQVVSSNIEETVIEFTFDQFNLIPVVTPNGNESKLQVLNTFPILKSGAPEIPQYSISLVVPDNALMKFEVEHSGYTDYENVNITPSKGNLLRNVNPNDIPYEYGREYQSNSFYPGELGKLDNAFIMRDVRGQTLHVFPYQYNPVSKTLRVYHDLIIKVFADGVGGENVLNRNKNIDRLVDDYKKIYQRHFVNYNVFENKYTPLDEEGSMLIICHDAWMSQLQPLVDWKNTIGRPTELVSVTDAGGTSTNIKNYVTQYYNTNNLAYLLLIGDASQVPTNSGSGLGGDSDNAYAYVSGNDHYLEFFVGRFSAENVDQVNTQVTRTIEYEKGDQLASGWLNKIMSVASNQGPGDDGELDYEHLRNIQTDLLAFTYETPVYEMFDGSQGGFDGAGDPTAANVALALNTGVGITNYVGHGSDTYWVTSGFSVSNVNALTNHNKLPFIFDVACVNGNFVSQTCFAEAWLRAQNAGEPTGAIAITASTINQSWSPPMVGQDEMNDILVGIAASGVKRTFGGIIVNGYFLMNEETSDFNMTDTWTCFGDPSLLVRTDDPATMVVSHSDVIVVGNSTFPVNCDYNGGLATLSYNGQIIGSDVVESGMAEISVDNLTPGQILTLAIVGFNKITYLGNVAVISPDGSYLVVSDYINSIDFGQTKNIDLTLKNVGTEISNNATAVMSTTAANATLTNTSFNFGTIQPDALSSTSTGVYTFTVDNDLPDQTGINVIVTITDDSDEEWIENKVIWVNAPEFLINEYTIDDSTGNNDGILDPGENATILVNVTNIGHAAVNNVVGQLASVEADVIVNSSTTAPTSLLVGANADFSFDVSASAASEDGTLVHLNFDVSGGAESQYMSSKSFEVVIGFVPEYCNAGSENSDDEYISNVTFNTINNPSNRSTYTDFTAISTTVEKGSTHQLSITNGEHWSSDQMGCWIDWNYDGDFTDSGEYFVVAYNTTTHIGTASILVPQNAHEGNNRMRVRVLYTGAILPCGNTSYGEVEDYTVVVSPSAGIGNQKINVATVFPNPNRGTFSVVLNENLKEAKLQIINIAGQVVFEKMNLDVSNNIDIDVKSGVYFAKIFTENGVDIKKIIIE